MIDNISKAYLVKVPRRLKKVHGFGFKDIDQLNRLPPADLQESILEAQAILSTLIYEIREFCLPPNLPDLRTIVTPILDKDEASNDQ